ncbi:MAG TPA: glutamate--tRNA ligase [Candidatus Saccharimonadales bacterium]|nr:glutamate--tRNA ligase [Candidatus Saccharimonadales bacterium]
MINEEVKEEIRKAALKNALDYGRARESTVINSALSRFPELKQNIKELSAAVKEEVGKINLLDKEEIAREAGAYSAEFEKAAEEKAEKSSRHNFCVEGAEEGKFVTRFPPEPGGYMHIGHAKPIFIEDELRRIYKGRMMLYFDDTNPDNERQEFVDAFHEDFRWLGISFDGEYYASDHLPKLYIYAAQAISKGGAYVCTCGAETVRKGRESGQECEHKKLSAEANMELWRKMLNGGFKDNEAILRLNSDLKALNTTLRDPTLFRIKNAEHYRQGRKYSVWPTYDFCTPIVDSINGITDVLRSKEYEMRDELYFRVLDLLGLRKPRITSFSRLEITNNLTSKRKIRDLISQKLISGWDDPRLVTIRGLRRRGVSPESIRWFSLSFGMGKSESSIGIERLLSENRRLLDPRATRLFFVEKPTRLRVEGIPEEGRAVRMKCHPSQDMGYREYGLTSEFFINAYDAINLKKGDQVRLKDAFEIRIESRGEDSLEASYMGEGSKGSQKLQWVNEGNYVEGKALMIGDLLDGGEFNKESMKTVEGYVEAHAARLKEGETAQFERVGFFKLDSKKEMAFISM